MFVLNCVVLKEKKVKNYYVTRSTSCIPMSWPKRVWDTPERTLNQEKTDELFAKIEENSIKISDPDNWALNGKHRRRHRQPAPVQRSDSDIIMVRRPTRTRKSIVVLTTISYATDSSDSLTDWEDFEF